MSGMYKLAGNVEKIIFFHCTFPVVAFPGSFDVIASGFLSNFGHAVPHGLLHFERVVIAVGNFLYVHVAGKMDRPPALFAAVLLRW